MDFAVYIGEEKTVIYKKNDGIVLNEPSLLAYRNAKLIAAGRSAASFEGESGVSVSPVVIHGVIQNVGDASVFFRHISEKVGGMGSCVFCISSSLTAGELNDFKTAIYSAGVGDAVFIPKVIAAAFENGYKFTNGEVLSVVIDGDFADMAVIKGFQIVDGGTLDDLSKLEESKKRLIRKHQEITQLTGDRMTVINGAGKLLSTDFIKKIVKEN